jgi:hypothetical protein
MNKYNEITTSHKVIGGREFNKGQTVRTVAISERDAKIMNSQPEHGFEYVLIKKELTDKEIRAGYFAKAAELGLSPAKNIKTDELKKLVEC